MKGHDDWIIDRIEAAELSDEDLEQVSGGRGTRHYALATTEGNLYQDPNANSTTIGKTRIGKAAVYTGEIQKDDSGSEWYKVKVHGHTAWVAANNCKII